MFSDSLIDRWVERNRIKILAVASFLIFLPVAIVAWATYIVCWFFRPPWWVPGAIAVLSALLILIIGPAETIMPGISWTFAHINNWFVSSIEDTINNFGAGAEQVPMSFTVMYIAKGAAVRSGIIFGLLVGTIPAAWKLTPKISPKPLTSEQRQFIKDFSKSKINAWLVKRAEREFERKRDL